MSPAHRTRASESGSRGLKPCPHLLSSRHHHQCQAALCPSVPSVKDSQNPARGGSHRTCVQQAPREPAAGVSVSDNVSIGGSQATGAGLEPVQAGGRNRVPSSAPREGQLLPQLSQSISPREGLGLAGLCHIPAPNQGSLTRRSCHCAAEGESDGTPIVLSRGSIPRVRSERTPGRCLSNGLTTCE